MTNYRTSERIPNVISNSRVSMKRRQCPFCKIDGNRTPPSFTSTWSALWHYYHLHKGEPGFEDEVQQIKKIAKHGNSVQEDVK